MSIKFSKVSVLYFIIGIGLGLYVGIIVQWALEAAHSHISLLGWVSQSIIGIIYYLFTATHQNKCAAVHFWSFNIGIPLLVCVVLFGVFLLIYGQDNLSECF